MYSFEQIADYLDDIVDRIPQLYMNRLQGIYLSPDTVHNEKIPSDSYYVAGRYIVDPPLPPRIELYYGSIAALYNYVDEPTIRQELRRIVYHELQHHVETEAGDVTLVLEDQRYVQSALKQLRKNARKQVTKNAATA